MFLYTIKDGRGVLPDSRREREREIRRHSGCCSVVVEAWTLVMTGMTGVVSFCTKAPMPLYTVRGHARPIRGGGCRGGALVAPSCA
jgi:hypothetical protein